MIDHHQLQVHFRVLALERGEQVRHEVLGAGFHRQIQLALQGTLQVRELHIQAFQTAENFAAGNQQGFGGVGQVELFRHVVEQGLPYKLFQLPNL